jgi:signal transduction histidine kinase
MHFITETDLMIDIIVGFLLSSAALAIAIYRLTVIYGQKQKQLEKANEILHGFSKMRAELFANISHEMKTPLAVISAHIQSAAYMYELARDEDNEKIQESFAIAQDEVMRVSGLVSDALRLASIHETGDKKSVLALSGVLIVCANSHAALLEKNGNTIITEIPDDMPFTLGSADRLSQVISNLIFNANTHTRNGLVRVSAKTGGDMLTVMVEDNGSGIAPDILPRVFERGVTDGSGSGLGLVICRQVITEHGGEIDIESEPGKGTKVRFTLPVYKEENVDG